MVSRTLVTAVLLLLTLPAMAAQWQHQRGPQQPMPSVQLSYPHQGVYQRGQAIILYQIESNSRVLNLRYPELHNAQVQSYRIPHTVTRVGPQLYRHTLGWTVHPLATGPLTLTLPDVEYRQAGVVTYRLHSEPFTLKVLPLPSYLPRQMPVGKLALSVPGSPWWLRVGDEVYIRVVIESDGIADSLYRPAAPTLLEPEEGGDRAQLEDMTVTVDTRGLHTRYRFLVPLTVRRSGLVWPKQTLQWFDPAQQRLQQQLFRLRPILLLARWQYLVLLLLLAAALLWLLYRAQRRIGFRLRQLRVYRQLMPQLAQLQQAPQVREALEQIAHAEGLPHGLPLTRLAERLWAATAQQQGSLETLQQLLYGQGDIVAARRVLAQTLRSRLGFWRFMLRQ